MKRKPLNKSRFTYLKQNTPLNVVPEKKLKKADLAGLIENRGKSRFRTKKLRERVETLIRSDLVFKNKTNASNKRIVPSPLTLLRTTFVPQARNTLKAKYPFHLNMNAKRTVHLLVVRTSVDRDGDRDRAKHHGHGHRHVVKQVGSTSAASVGVGVGAKQHQHQHQQASCSGSSTTTLFGREAISKAISKAQSNCVPSKAHEQKKMVEKDEIGTKYIVKRTVLGSTRMFSNTRFKVHSQDLKQLIEGRGRKVSPYKARLLERKKLSLIYGNLGWRELRKCVLQSKHKKGVASPKSGNKKTRPQTSSLPENLITLLESRLDVVLYRCRFFPSFSSCKQAINHGKIFVNHRQVRIAGHLLKAGDLIQVNPQSKQSLLVVRTSVDRDGDGDRAKGHGHGHASKSEHKQFQRNATKTFVACPGSARKEQEHVVSKKANYLLALENEKQKTLLYFQNKIKSRPFFPFLPSALLTRFDPLHHFPWNTKQKPNQLNNTTLFGREAISKAIALHNKQDYGSCFLRPSCLGTAVPASDPLSTSFNRTTSCKARSPLSLNLENRANSLFRDLKERKRILRTLSSRSNERLDGDGKSFDHVTRTTGRLIKPLRNRDNPFLFLRPQSKSGVMRSNPLARTNNKGIAGSGIGKEHNTLSTVGTARAATGLRGLMLCQGKKHESKSEHVLRATTLFGREAISKAIKQSTGLKKLFPPFYRAVKPLNLEVSYQTLTAIFLFPPQKIYFPAHIDLEMIGKSI